jgi:outer membrane lipopolysaccharide assembly protein LptE/RlpB
MSPTEAGASRLLAVALAVMALAGCGYSLRGNLPAHIKTVAVPILTNKTTEPAVENSITAAIVDAFANSGKLKVVPLGEADSVLEGEIVGYQLQSVAFDQRLNVREYRLQVTLNVQFRDARRGEMLWRQEGLQEFADFRVPGQAAATISREEGAVREAARDIGRKIVNLAVDRF